MAHPVLLAHPILQVHPVLHVPTVLQAYPVLQAHPIQITGSSLTARFTFVVLVISFCFAWLDFIQDEPVIQD